MNEQLYGHFVRQNLNRSARSLSEPVVNRLAKVRQNALECQKASPRRAALATVSGRIDYDEAPRHITRFVAVLLVSLSCAAYWQAQEYIAGLEEVDTAILTDELPLDALVDKGFDAWRRSAAER